MEAKANLNNTQRKILESIYVEQMKTMRRDAVESLGSKRGEFIATLRTKVTKDPSVKAIKKALDNLVNTLDKHEHVLKSHKVGIDNLKHYNSESYTASAKKFVLVVEDGYDRRNPDLVAFDQKVTDLGVKWDKAIMEVRAKVWGLNVSYEDMEKEIKAVIESL